MQRATIWAVFTFGIFCFWGCDFDREDAAEDRIVDVGEIPSYLDSGSEADDCPDCPDCPDCACDDTDSTGPDTEPQSDYSCHNTACTTQEQCACHERSFCVIEPGAPPFINEHCFIIDCDPADPSTCPEGVPCLDASKFSQGILDNWLCFAM